MYGNREAIDWFMFKNLLKFGNNMDRNGLNNRHGFITFWLWLCAIANVLTTLGYVLLLFSSKGLWSATPEPIWLRLLWLIGSLALLVGYILLICWDKIGFYVIAIIQGLSVLINLIIGGLTDPIITSFLPLVALVLLYGVLHLSKSGLSYWDAMDKAEEAWKSYSAK